MRIILSLLLLIFLNSVSAKNFYFSAVSGNDLRTAAQAQSSSTPWRTLDRLNSFFDRLQPGDSILFKRGETFYGSIAVSTSGTISRPIVIGAFGTGPKPVITGLQTLSGWLSSESGKYVSFNPSLGEAVNVVTLNGVAQAMGRYPNANAGNNGYLSFESHGSNYIKDNQLPGSPDWNNAELVVRTNRFVLDRVKIISHSGTKIFYSPGLSYEPADGFGYFIQNDIRTLDQPGEWYYNPASRKMTMYFSNSAASAYDIKASAVKNIVYLYNKHNIVFDNLAITGANHYAFYIYSANNVVIKNCNISFTGIDAISVSNTTNLKIEGNTIANTNNIAINLGNCANSLIKNNEIKNTGLLHGLGRNSSNKTVAIRETGSYNTIEYNQIDSTGYSAIRFDGEYCLVKNNFINHFNLTKDDGGGIYTSATKGIPHYGKKVIGNIILNGSGAAAGTTYSIAASTTGIYMDDYAANVEVTGNTVAYCSRSGAFLHNAHDITLRDNTFYNSLTQVVMTHDYVAITSPLRNNTVKNNILFSKKPFQFVFAINSMINDLSLAGNIDSNYYCRPLDDTYTIKSSYLNSKGLRITQNLDLKSWQTVYKKDISSKKTAIEIIPFRLKNLIGSNKFTNGAFNDNISGAKVYSTAAKHATSWIENKLDKGTLQGTVSSSIPCTYSIYIPIGAVKQGKNYIVAFSVQNSKDTLLNVFARQAGNPYTILSNSGYKNVLKISPERKDYELSFSPQISESNSFLVFEANTQKNNIWLDNIKVYEADIDVTNPDDSIRFEYNATQSDKSIALSGTYVDARGTVYKNSIVLAPYTSAVLVKKNSAEISEPTVRITSPVINAKYNAPATINLTAIASDAGGTIKQVAFYNGATLLATEKVSPYSWSWKNVPAGNYTLTAKATSSSGKIAVSAGVPISVGKSGYPTVKITSPVTNTSYTASSTISITATASDVGGTIRKVEFYNGTDLVHSEYVAPYTFLWKNAPAGKYTLTAKAVDNDGNVTTSGGVTISVVKSAYPIVKITSPVINSQYTAPATITVAATASDADGKIRKVEFYEGTDLIHSEYINPYTFSWENVPAGNYILTAKAVDDDGNVTTSAGVPVSVVRPSDPIVEITSPAVNSKYSVSATINLSANAAAANGKISKIEFYNGAALLATEKVAPYSWSWKNVPVGNHKITAKATDTYGKVTFSPGVTVSVVPSKVSVSSPLPGIANETFDSSNASLPGGIGNLSKSFNFKLFPNPAINKIQVYFDDFHYNQKGNISIVDLVGKTLKYIPVVFSGQKIEVDLSSLNSGMYILRFSGENIVVNKKFVKTN